MTRSKISPLTNPSPKVDFFSNLPSELIIDILSRLSVETIINCKCVHKSWLNLIETREFAKSHHSKSVPLLAVCGIQGKSFNYEIYELEEGLDLHYYDLNCYILVTELDLPFNGWISGSADGLLFLCDRDTKPHSLYVCNPIARDYTVFHDGQELDYSPSQVVTYGFGVSKTKAQHKVVRISHDRVYKNQDIKELLEITKTECRVYTLETGTWRSVVPSAPFHYISITNQGILWEGNLHWLVYDLNKRPWISCFDLETELFSTFAAPFTKRRKPYYLDLFVFRDHLCLCYRSNYYKKTVIWTMEDYGVDKSWTKKFSSKKSSKKNRTKEVIDSFKREADSHYENGVIYTPSFFSLTSFGFQNVITF